MAQKTAWTGAILAETDINTYLMHEGGAWTTYTPTLTQSATVTKTVTFAHYGRAGRLIYGNVLLTVTGTGTASNAVQIGLPVAAVAGGNTPIGVLAIFDTSASTWYHGASCISTSTTALGNPNGFTGSLGVVSFTAALAVGDLVGIQFLYEAVT